MDTEAHRGRAPTGRQEFRLQSPRPRAKPQPKISEAASRCQIKGNQKRSFFCSYKEFGAISGLSLLPLRPEWGKILPMKYIDMGVPF
jgi:hypothetical protein